MSTPHGLRSVESARPFPVGPSTIEELWAGRDPRSPALVDRDQEWSTARLRAEVDRVARALAHGGIEPGDRVGWVVRNDVTAVVGLLATIRLSGLWVGLHPRASPTEHAAVVAEATPAAVLDRLPDRDPGGPLPEPPPRWAPAAIAYTSGTTGRPKGAVHSQQQLLYPAAAAMATEGLDATARIATPLPLSTLNMVLLGPLTALACGGVAVLLDRTDPGGFASDVERHAVTRALVVPTIVHDLVSRGTDPRLLRSLDRMILGGSGIDRDRARHARRVLSVPLLTSYGLSEAPSGVARMAVEDAAASPLPGIDIGLDGEEITLAPTTTGAWAGTWQGTLGYWAQPERSAELWRDGRLHTGDTGSLDNGRLTVRGRIVDMIDRGGAMVSPAEVEAALRDQPGVRDAAVFGAADDRLGQAVAAAVVGAVDPAVVTEGLRASLSAYKVPERWLVLDALPRNRSGKVDRQKLQRLLATEP